MKTQTIIKNKFISVFLACTVLFTGMAGCGQVDGESSDADNVSAVSEEVFTDSVNLKIETLEDEAVAMASAPAISNDMLPNATGENEKRSNKAVIDYSNIEDGYVMVKYLKSTKKRLKVQVKGPKDENNTYTYNITPKKWVTFPLSCGNGDYKVTVYENVYDNKYAMVLSVDFSVKLKDEFAPFLLPNQYVNYANAKYTVKKAKAIIGRTEDPLKKVKKIYNYVVKNIKYDKKLAKTVKSGYLPDLDKVLKKKKGICFDYASLMTGMLRSQGVPCKLVIGYAGTSYHAWISVYTEDHGWIDNAIFFDGSSWHRMDPTFASSGKKSKSVMKYIGNGKNYSAKYFY